MVRDFQHIRAERAAAVYQIGLRRSFYVTRQQKCPISIGDPQNNGIIIVGRNGRIIRCDRMQNLDNNIAEQKALTPLGPVDWNIPML